MVGIPVGWASVVALFIPVLTALAVKERAEDNRIHALFGMALTGVVAVVGMLTDDTAQHTVPCWWLSRTSFPNPTPKPRSLLTR